MTSIAKIIIPIAALIAVGSCNAQGSVATVPTQQQPAATATSHNEQPRLEFAMTGSVTKADDRIIRIKGSLIGAPHTSHRINGARLLIGNVSYEATDIDGVDFERYFQWEDDGIIPLEIDFSIPKGKKMPKIGKNSCIIFSTVHGEYVFDCK